MTWHIARMPLDGPLFEGAIRVYGEAFILPPYRDPDRGREVRDRLLTQHRHRSGFRALIGLEDFEDVIAMAYGYTARAGQWWHDQVAGSLGSARSAPWLRSAFELVEIAVRPDRQGRGVGSLMITELLRDRPEATSVLSTRTDSQAHHLYRRLGFQVIHEMRFAPGAAPFYIMGKRLHFQTGADEQSSMPKRG